MTATDFKAGSGLTLNAIAGARVIMNAQHVDFNAPDMTNIDRLSMLMQSVTQLTGHIANTSSNNGISDKSDIERALVNIAAIATAWLDSYDV
jgi:hypothetical protein